jgi:diguanylate cyclase (GGDEF)-like protein
MVTGRPTTEPYGMGKHGLNASLPAQHASMRPGLVRLRGRGWLMFLGVGLGAALGAGFVGDAVAVRPLLIAMGLATTAAVLIGTREHRPAKVLPWLLLAGCTLATTVGGVFVPMNGVLGVLGQLSTVGGSVAGMVGFVMLMRGRIPGGDRAAFLDAAILASGTGVLIWAFGFAPYAVAAHQSSVVAIVFFYPTLILLAMVARMWFLAGAHRPGTRLIVMLVVASNAILILDVLRGMAGSSAFNAPGLVATVAELAFLGAAALHPSMAILPEHLPADVRHVSRRRIVALTAALLVNPATLAIEASGGHQVDPVPYIIGGALIGFLVIGRLGDAMRELGESLRERESLADRLRHQALYDGLTSLPNRRYFTDRLQADFENRTTDRPLAVLLIDLDEFKAVNDTYGHVAGDDLLISVGKRLRGALRDTDMAARLGGDEFVISLPACATRLIPVQVGERVLAAFAEPFDIGRHRVAVGASIGIAIAGPEDESADDLVRNADIAMYLAKSRGKGRLEVFDESMQAEAITQLQRVTDLAAGIVGGELRLHYQPVVDMRTGQAIGYEALVRWLRDGKLVPPMEFIPLAESSGLIGPLTDWVVAEACRTTAPWGKPGDRPWVSVNLPSSQLVREDMVAYLAGALETSGLSPNRLVIELTESSLVDIDVARPAIERLSELGVRLAIDDFGTGYSALSYLARLPIDILKIDRSFVTALEEEGPEEAIAAAIIALAKRLGLTTIGEGIETAPQLDRLAALGCDLGQGYFLGRPAPDEDRRPTPVAQIPRPHLTSVPASTPSALDAAS